MASLVPITHSLAAMGTVISVMVVAIVAGVFAIWFVFFCSDAQRHRRPEGEAGSCLHVHPNFQAHRVHHCSLFFRFKKFKQ
jgi:hypothetical protein